MTVLGVDHARHDEVRPRRRVRLDLSRPVTVAAVLIGAQLLLRGSVAASGWFHLDDLVFIQRAVVDPFDLAYLLRPHAGHLMPGSYVIVSAVTALGPGHWPLVVLVDLSLLLAVDVAVLRLLVTLFGRRPAVLVPFALFVAGTLTLPASVWWAAALNQLPMLLAMSLALTAHVQRRAGGGSAASARCLAAVLGGLAFSEKTVLVVPLIVVLDLVWFTTGSLRERLVTAWRRDRTTWSLHGTVLVGYGILYVSLVPAPLTGPPDPTATAGAYLDALVRVWVPGLLGGPWQWRPVPATLPTADTPPALAVVAGAVALAAVVGSVVRSRGAGPAWVLVLGWFLLDALLVAASRGQVFDVNGLLREYRYVTDGGLVAVLGVALAFLPVVHGTGLLRRRSTGRPPPGRPSARALRVGAFLAGTTLAVGSIHSHVGYAAAWSQNAARDWADRALASAAERPGAVVTDTTVPDAVMWAALAPYTRASTVLAGRPGAPVFLGDGVAIGDLTVFDDRGELVGGTLDVVGRTPRGPAPACGWPIAEEAVVPLAAAVPRGRWMVRLVYLSSAPGPVVLEVAGRRTTGYLQAGVGQVYVQVTGPVDGVRVTAGPTTPVCVAAVEVGVPVAPGVVR